MQKSIKEDIKFIESKLEKNLDSILFARLADAYLQADRLEESLELCENSIKKHPFYVTGHYVLAKIYLKKKLFDQAEKELKRVLLFDPKYIAAHRDYAELMLQIGWHNSAVISNEEILHIDPFNEKARIRLNELKAQTPQPREPIKETQPEIEYDMIEENMLANSAHNHETMEPVREEIAPEKNFSTPELQSAYPQETTYDFEDEQANLDMLEDIFRDDLGADLLLDEDSKTRAKPSQQTRKANAFELREPAFLSNPLPTKPKIEVLENNDFEGLEDDEMASIMSDEMTPEKQKPAPPPPEEKRQFSKRSEPPENEVKIEKPESDESDKRKEKIVTPTLGEIYAAQQQYAKAIGVYAILRKKDPTNDLYRQKIEYLQKKLDESRES